MQIRRARSALALSHIRDMVLETGEMPKEVYLALLGERLNDPELSKQTFVVVGIDDTNKNKVIGHLVAIAEPNVEWVWVYEAVYDLKIGVEKATEVTMKVRESVIAWANFLGRPAIRMQTKRDPLVWERKWGMKTLATVMELRLDTVLNEQIFEELNIQPETNHGRINNHEGVGTDGRAATSSGTDREIHLGSEAESANVKYRSDVSLSGSASGEDSSGDGATSDAGKAALSVAELANVHERYLASVERTEGV